MRDTLKSKEYFEKRILYEKARIEKFTNVVATLDISNETGLFRGKLYIANYYMNLLKLVYSIGGAKDEVYNYYTLQLQYYKDVCSPNSSTHEIIDILSIGVLFYEKKNEFIEDLQTMVARFNSTDGLVINLLNYLENKPVEIINSKLDYFNELVIADDKKSVLSKELVSWYKHHKGAYWYDSHESKVETYCGYWCFEIAALAKLFSVDDSEFKNHPYYPYDLAHQ